MTGRTAGPAPVFGDGIAGAMDAAALGDAWRATLALAPDLRADGVSAFEVAAVVSRVVREMTARAAVLVEQALAAEGRPPPAAFAVLVLGSAGRGESLLKPDQDNAIVFDGDAGLDPWFAAFGERMCGLLDEAGIPLCHGGVMAKNPGWRGDVLQWEARVGDWIGSREPEDLLNVDIFFDFVAVHGDRALAERLRSAALDAAAGSIAFLRGLALQLVDSRPPLGWALFGFGSGIQTVDGRADLKRGGTLPVVASARVMALRHRVAATGTADRLRAVSATGHLSEIACERLAGALETVMAAILDQQIADRAAGRPAGTGVEIARLSKLRRRVLRAALERVDEVEAMAEAVLDR